MRLLPHQICLIGLRGRRPFYGRPLPAPEEAARKLHGLTGQDFGRDARVWSAWTRANGRDLYRRPERDGPPRQETRMARDKREKRDLHALDADGMVLCNPRDREAAHRAEMESIATEDHAMVTCKKCLDLLRSEGKRPREA